MKKDEMYINKRLFKQVKGITLIALVVTIIVLLILAGIALNLTIGQNGIMTRAQTAVIVNENASVYEQLQLKVVDYQMENIENNTEAEILTRLKEDGYVRTDNTVNVENLMEKEMKTGKGSIEKGDVYVLEQRQETASTVKSDQTNPLKYYLIYYSEKNESNTNLGLAFEGSTEEEFYEPTDESYFEYDEATGAIALKDSNSYYKGGIMDREIGLKTIVVPSKYNGKTVTKIGITYRGGHALGINAIDVENIILPETITAIVNGNGSSGAFDNCRKLKEIKLSTNITYIGDRAFSGCSSLTNIEIPTGVTYIGNYAFSGCSSLTSIEIPTGVTYIGNYVFSGCSSLTSIEIPTGVTYIGNYAFSRCSALTSIEIPSKVESIGNKAFAYCAALKSITIPGSVKNMGEHVFDGCDSLEKIYVSFNKGEQPEGWAVDDPNISWDSNWSDGCHATIVYANGETEQLNSES